MVKLKSKNLKKGIKWHTLCLFLCFHCLAIQPLSSQNETTLKKEYTWEQFLEDYMQSTEQENQTESDEELYNELYFITQNPFNLNQIKKEQLQQLPFLNEKQIESILRYVSYNKPLYGVGELWAIKSLNKQTINYLKLFLYCGKEEKEDKPLQQWYTGRWELSSRLQVPLYKQQGYKYNQIKPSSFASQAYLGNQLYHNLKLLYNYHNQLSYGLQLEKDAGEPFGQYGTQTYDAISFFINYADKSNTKILYIGDFTANWNKGLILGKSFFTQKYAFSANPSSSHSRFMPHRSFSENDYFRGIAFHLNFHNLLVQGMGGYKTEDATLLKNNEVSAVNSSGLHRTKNELNKKQNLFSQTYGLNLTYNIANNLSLSASSIYTHYHKTFASSKTLYKRYAFQGKDAWNNSLSYLWRLKNLHFSGEIALDKQANLAMLNTLKWTLPNDWRLGLAQRFFSIAYNAPWAKTLQEGSKVKNEDGILASLNAYISPRLSSTTYIDFFYFPWVTYTASKSAKGFEFYQQFTTHIKENYHLSLQYRLKSKEKNYRLSATASPFLAPNTTHSLNFSIQHQLNPFLSFRLKVGGKYGTIAQLEKHHGYLIALTGKYHKNSTKTQLFMAYAKSDHHTMRMFVYEPNFRYAFASSFLSKECIRLAVIGEQLLGKYGRVGLKAGFSYFPREKHIQTGSQKIAGNKKTDLSCFLLLQF